MVDLSIGVLAIQGAVSEHVAMLKHALRAQKLSGNVSIIRKQSDMASLDGLILPGGESTTISKMMQKTGLFTAISKRIAADNLYVMGTCAGCVLLATELDHPDEEITLLQAMDMQVKRNAFGRQYESFEQEITFSGFPDPYHAVFIRAPVITKTGEACTILATLDKKSVVARQNKFLALSFHPELTDDIRVHSYFLQMMI